MSNPTILLVDDEPMVTQMLSMLLEISLPVRVLASNCPVEALRIIDREPIALLLTDYLMPEINGISLTRTLRARGHTIPVILLTGYCDEPELTAHAEALAPFIVMVKPWKNEVLLQKIKQALKGS